MYRTIISLLVAGSLFTTAALADDDVWADDPIISNDPVVAEESDEIKDVGEVEGQHELINPDFMGMYFGADGQISHDTASLPRNSRTVDYHGEQVIFPEYGRGAYSSENVYGPMWGVPGDAPGLEGYDPYYYYIMSGGDMSQLTAAQRIEIEQRIRSNRVDAEGGATNGSSGIDTESSDSSEGIDMQDDYWDV